MATGLELLLQQDGVSTDASSLGSGTPVYHSKSGDTLRFKTLNSGAGMAIADDGAGNLTLTATGTISGGENIGLGTGLFYGVSSGNLQLRTLNAGSSVELVTEADGSVTISVTSQGAGEVNTNSNAGVDGAGLVKTKVGADTPIKRIKQGANVTIEEFDTYLVINSTDTDTGETNTASNAGLGVGVFYQKTSEDLRFKSFTAGNGINIVDDGAGTITIESTIDPNTTGEINTGANLGNGVGVYAGKVNTELRFRTLKAGDNTSVEVDGNGNIVISATDTNTGEVNTTSNAGTTGFGLALTKSGTDLPFKRIKDGPNIDIIDHGDYIEIAAASVDPSVLEKKDASITSGTLDFAYADIQVIDASAGAVNITDFSNLTLGVRKLLITGSNKVNISGSKVGAQIGRDSGTGTRICYLDCETSIAGSEKVRVHWPANKASEEAFTSTGAAITVPAGIGEMRRELDISADTDITISGMKSGDLITLHVKNTSTAGVALTVGTGNPIVAVDGLVPAVTVGAGQVWEVVFTKSKHGITQTAHQIA
jgi:hypothetical protein